MRETLFEKDTLSTRSPQLHGVREHARKPVMGTGEQPHIRKGADGRHYAAVIHLEQFGTGVREHARVKESWEPVSSRSSGRAQTDHTELPCCTFRVSSNTGKRVFKFSAEGPANAVRMQASSPCRVDNETLWCPPCFWATSSSFRLLERAQGGELISRNSAE